MRRCVDQWAEEIGWAYWQKKEAWISCRNQCNVLNDFQKRKRYHMEK